MTGSESRASTLDFEGYHPEKVILTELHKKLEIDYERCSKLLFKLITQVCDHYETGYGINGMQNIVMMYRREIAGKICDQMMKHFYCENGLFQEEVIDVEYSNLPQKLNCRQKVGLYDVSRRIMRGISNLFCSRESKRACLLKLNLILMKAN